MSGIREWLLKKRWRVILSGVLIVAAPLVSIAVFINFELTSAFEERIIRGNKDIAAISAHSIEERLKSDIELGKAYATRPRLLEGLAKKDKKEMDIHLRMIVNNSHTIERAFITDHKGIQLANYPETKETLGKDFSHRDWYKGVSKSRAPYVSEFYMRLAQPQRYLFAIALPVKQGERITGILVLQPNDNYIKDAIGRIDLGKRLIYVTDRKGNLVYHSQHITDRIIDFSHVPAVQKALKGLDGIERIQDPRTKEPFICAYHPVSKWGWGVVVEKPESLVLAPVRRVTFYLIAVTSLMLLIGGYLAYKGAELFVSTQRLAADLGEQESFERMYSGFLVLLNRQFSSVGDICNAALLKFTEQSGIDAGVIHAFENDRLIPYAAFSVRKPSATGSLCMECIKQKKMLELKDIPPDTYLKVETGMGILMPKDITAIPLLYKDEIVGALELASLKGFEEADIKNLQRIADQLAIGISTVKAQIARKALADNLSRSNEELQAMNSELQAMNEEVQAMNEELQTQQKELADANLRLTDASKAKSDFLANMSHELRTPLNSILGFSEILQDELFGKLNEKQLEYMKDIHASGKHLLSLINDILDLSKVEAGKMELEPMSFLLRDTLNASLSLLKEKAMKRGIKMSLELEPDADMEIEADERKLKQIMFNLLSNAEKFTPDGGYVHVHAAKASEAGGDFIRISVADTGIGIEPEDIPKLFQEFTQLESAYTKTYEGTGLGLALTRRLVELHGGKVWVESESGVGSKFTFTMPVKQPVRTKGVSMTEKRQEKAAGTGRRAVVIDDDPKTLDIVSSVLAEEGYGVIKAPGGKEGIDSVMKALPDMIILDLIMPDMSGFEVLDVLASDEKTRHIPVIVLTAMNLSAIDKTRLEDRVKHIIEKGRFTREEFAARIKSALGN
ncbi:MAG: hypothetical protein A2077_07715 [Nitrospirae bacterium GWC2_46_6]|nr:MAG: hypothetical protein A2077_07715 [Nitrospirae bacterium GWC2_46_6]HAK88864.1 hypothetical protein [Nitrospiraceae bacterium]